MNRLYRKLKKELQITTHKFPYRVQCNVCNWRGRSLFSDSWHPNTVCPRCGSQVRHRLLFASVNMIDNLGINHLIQGKRVLHFAPEPAVSKLLVKTAAKYVSADLHRKNVDLQLDMSNMSSIADNSFDLVVACDVLEHVPDDSAALREIHRVLTALGWVILTVPPKDNLATKYEDPTITTPEEREQAFGQEDHLRIYGNDFVQFLESHGFHVTTIDEKSFDPEIVQKYVLFPPVLSSHPLATNYRKVYFAQRLAV